MSIIIGILVFALIVLVHEWGHFIVARMNGILVEEFAIGMGPKLFGVTKGDTLYTIRALPLGGYCKMLGEDKNETDPRAFNNKKVWQRMLVVVAGAFMNFVLAVFLFSSIALFSGYSTTTIIGFSENSPAQEAGLSVGDEIIKINNDKMHIFEDLSFAIASSNGEPIEVTYKHNNEVITTTITPYIDEYGSAKIGVIPEQEQGISQSNEGYKKIGFFEAIMVGWYKLVFWIKVTIDGIISLLTFNVAINQLAGPIGVVSAIGTIYDQTIKESIMEFIFYMANFAALLSLSVGAFNLMPFPALDGGRFVFLSIEGILRKPVPEEIEGRVHFIGFALLMLLALVVAIEDILRIIS